MSLPVFLAMPSSLYFLMSFSFSGVTFVLFCMFVFLLSLKPLPYVPTATATRVSSFFVGDVAFSKYFCIITVLFSPSEWCLKKNLNAPRPSEHPPVVFFHLVTTGWILDSAYVIIQIMKK